MGCEFDAASELAFYTDHLKNNILPFWLENGTDAKKGGYFTCFSNDGSTLTSTDKYTWSQGRMVWILSALSEMACFSRAEQEDLLSRARSGASFLMEHCRLPDGNCAFLMDRSGTPRIPDGESVYDTSIFADCFVIIGLARLAVRNGDAALLSYAWELYRHVTARFESGDFMTQPYPDIPGWRGHPMMQLSIAEEMAWALESFGKAEAERVSAAADGCIDDTLRHFVTEDFLLHERIHEDGSIDNAALYGRYVNPGHTIENLWFMMHQAAGIPAGRSITGQAIQDARPGALEFAKTAARILKSTFKAGWDEQYGGLLLFADIGGGKPRGGTFGMEAEEMVRKITNDWQSKLWWPHSEALYTPLLLYRFTGDEELLHIYRKVFEYTFNTFPNPGKSAGEWIQIRDRLGRPENKVVALPVKDPFHIMRNLLLIIRLLEGWIES